MGKFFAITIVIIALASAVPIVRHTWAPPQNISVHGSAIDDQMSETMVEAGFSFLAAQFVLAVLVWKFSSRPRDAKVTKFPGGAKGLVIAALILVGSEILALGILGQKAWASVYFTPPAANAIPVQVQAGQFAFYFRYPGPDGKFGPLHPEKIDEANQNFYGLDVDHDPESKDDIVTAELAIPVNRDVHLLMHSKDDELSGLKARMSVSELTSVIGHELNNPLAALVNYMDNRGGRAEWEQGANLP